MIKYYLQSDSPDLARGSTHAAGWDLVAQCSMERELSPGVVNDQLTLGPGTRFLINTGLFISMPPGVCAMLCSRSGLSLNHGVIVLNAPGIIDADYRGEVKVTLANLSDKPHTIRQGDRIGQLLFVPVMEIFAQRDYRDSVLNPHLWKPHRVKTMEELGSTERGTSGHGSTGR